MASIFDLLTLTPPSTPWVRPAAVGRGLVGPASDFLTPDGHLIPRAIGEAALRDSRAILIGDLLVLGTPDTSAKSNW